jgi:hypothetical protein
MNVSDWFDAFIVGYFTRLGFEWLTRWEDRWKAARKEPR